jgi:para-nitrobenzyl esterase
MATYWTNFAKNGNPNGDGVPAWPDFKREDEKLMRFDGTTVAGSVPNRNGLQLFDDFYTRLRKASRANAK